MTTRRPEAPRWVSSFYDRKGLTSGPSGVLDHHRERAAAVKRFGGKSHGRVLELGAGSGGSAVVTAELGYSVVAVELSPVRAGFASDLTRDRADLTIEVRVADFMTVELRDRFDVVTCWNGFGVGTDADQRELLRRIRHDWLADEGVAILDIFNPVGWSRLAGETSIDEETGLRSAIDFRRCGEPAPGHLVVRWRRGTAHDAVHPLLLTARLPPPVGGHGAPPGGCGSRWHIAQSGGTRSRRPDGH